MEAICKLLAAKDAGQASFTGGEFRMACLELRDLGWVHQPDKPRFNHMAGRNTFPWWRDPETGEEVSGVVRCMRIAFNRYMVSIGVAA